MTLWTDGNGFFYEGDKRPRDRQATEEEVAIFEQAQRVGRTLSFVEFIDLFTEQEKTSILASTDPQVKLFILLGSSSGSIRLNSPRVISGVDTLVTAGLLTLDRREQILSGNPPQ